MRTHVSRLLPLLAMAACTVMPAEPAEGRAEAAAGALRLDAAALTLTRLGQEERVHAAAGERTTGAPVLRVVEETRWFPDRAVLDSAALAAGSVVARAPGRVRLEAAAFGLVAPLLAEVAPAPYVAEAGEERGGEVVLRGYRLDLLPPSALRWEEGPATVLERDSASMRVAVPPAPAGCVGGGYARLRVEGGEEGVLHEVRRARPGELALAPGEVRALSPAEAACLRLAPAAGAAYAVAYVDPTAIRRAQGDGREERVRETSFTVSAADRTRPGAGSALARSAAAAPAGPPAPPAHPRLEASAAETLYQLRAGTWSPGYAFTA